jgi:ABC-2 type transport system ATP-binding protein
VIQESAVAAGTRLGLDGVARSYGSREVLAEISLVLAPGQVLGLLGPNGAGKTTLLSIMACALAPTRGRVVVGGVAVVSESTARVARRSIGWLPQSPSWVPSFTALETVEYSAWLKGVPGRAQGALAREALGLVGMADEAGSKMRRLSGGMVQRVCLAAALVARPKVLLLDEPTAGLDPSQRLAFRSMIGGLSEAAVVLSTHLTEDVAVLADDALVLDRGRVVFCGTPSDLARLGGAGGGGSSALELGYESLFAAPDGGARV